MSWSRPSWGCRKANLLFQPPPWVPLGRPVGLAPLQLGEVVLRGRRPFSCQGDVPDGIPPTPWGLSACEIFPLPKPPPGAGSGKFGGGVYAENLRGARRMTVWRTVRPPKLAGADLLPCVPFDSMVNCQRFGTMHVFAFDSMAICQQHGFVCASAFDSMDTCHHAGLDALADSSADL